MMTTHLAMWDGSPLEIAAKLVIFSLFLAVFFKFSHFTL